MEAEHKAEQKVISRRKFLLGAGALAAGAAVTGGVTGLALPGRAVAGETVRIVVNGREVVGPVPARLESDVTLAPVRAVAESMGATVLWEGSTRTVDIKAPQGAAGLPPWPWQYAKLDPEVVRKRGYEGYYQGGCCYGTAFAIIGALAEQVGPPFTAIPVDIFRYGEGGAVGWGTLCGALNGAGAAITLVCGKGVYNKLVNELLGWYTREPFPSKKHDTYSKFPGQVQNVSGSPLCHVSVTEWCKASGYKVSDPERLERCAKLTGDVAAFAVELLNKQADGVFAPAYKAGDEFAGCISCHVGKDSALNNVQGRMNCVQCHQPH
ncbi:MAG: C-GCAxxG-C-C family (seleno)protein [Bacillota bacterium]|nr:C-GCAxxG-C-C family (seleno)protein [Bacillota bacterium]MDI7249610.1 C-GCAxxG-C-C family (seleno)protein [Bacillota bacterium]